jgi:threonine dehydrogenase-like Zn-dependent dehydrogenase
MGARTLVVGEGFLARVARAVALSVGCRVAAVPGRGEETPVERGRPDIVIETTGERSNLDRAVERCRDWGKVFSMAGALTSLSLDYYSHVHRRALTMAHVSERPVLLPGEEDHAERCAALLAEALRGITPSQDEVLEARVLPGETPGCLARERSGWGLLRVE